MFAREYTGYVLKASVPSLQYLKKLSVKMEVYFEKLNAAYKQIKKNLIKLFQNLNSLINDPVITIGSSLHDGKDYR